jgi:hypothetical protein
MHSEDALQVPPSGTESALSHPAPVRAPRSNANRAMDRVGHDVSGGVGKSFIESFSGGDDGGAVNPEAEG